MTKTKEVEALSVLVEAVSNLLESAEPVNGSFRLRDEGVTVLLATKREILIPFMKFFRWSIKTGKFEKSDRAGVRSIYRLHLGPPIVRVAHQERLSAYTMSWDTAFSLARELELSSVRQKLSDLKKETRAPSIGRPQKSVKKTVDESRNLENSGTFKFGEWIVDANGICYPFRDHDGRSRTKRAYQNKEYSPPPEYEIRRCMLWLDLFCEKSKKVFDSRSSYGFKHSVEAWVATMVEQQVYEGKETVLGSYTSNGAFIIAALRLGYKMTYDSDDRASPNGLFWIKPKNKMASLEGLFFQGGGEQNYVTLSRIVSFPKWNLDLDNHMATRCGPEILKINKEQAYHLRQKGLLPKSFGNHGVITPKFPKWLKDKRRMATIPLTDAESRFEEAKKEGFMLLAEQDSRYGQDWFKWCEDQGKPYIVISQRSNGYFVLVDNIGCMLEFAEGMGAKLNVWTRYSRQSIDGCITFESRRLLLDDAVKCARQLVAASYVNRSLSSRSGRTLTRSYPIAQLILDFLSHAASDLQAIHGMLLGSPIMGDGAEYAERSYKFIANEALVSLVTSRRVFRDQHGFYHLSENDKQWQEAYHKMLFEEL